MEIHSCDNYGSYSVLCCSVLCCDVVVDVVLCVFVRGIIYNRAWFYITRLYPTYARAGSIFYAWWGYMQRGLFAGPGVFVTGLATHTQRACAKQKVATYASTNGNFFADQSPLVRYKQMHVFL